MPTLVVVLLAEATQVRQRISATLRPLFYMIHSMGLEPTAHDDTTEGITLECL